MKNYARSSKQTPVDKQDILSTIINTANTKAHKRDKQRLKPEIEPLTINIANARAHIREIVAEVARTGKCVTISVRDVPSVMMVSVAVPVAPVGNYEYKLACIISEKLLGDAPLHILKSQIKEFASLNREKLFALMEIENFPLSVTIREQVQSKLSDPVILERLEKRRKIADSILAAKREGLYEASEHATGLLTFE